MSPKSRTKKKRFVLIRVHWTTDCHIEMCAVKLSLSDEERKIHSIYDFASSLPPHAYADSTLYSHRHTRTQATFIFVSNGNASALILLTRPFATCRPKSNESSGGKIRRILPIWWRAARIASLYSIFSGALFAIEVKHTVNARIR